ncbi:MAG: HEAT repeat domain-containing protein [Fimbriiglobus sp.]|nr:HEAT repeat domain-containing protein [Fimbriiglobus sp.]
MRRLFWLLPLFALPVALIAADPVKEPDLPDGTDKAVKQLAAFNLPKGMRAELFAAEPMVLSPVAISVDDKGRVFAAEVHRLGRGVVENRDNPAFPFSFFLDDDLQIQTAADRLKVYEKHKSRVPGGMDWYTKYADQVRRLEDTTGDGKADKSTVFAGGFNRPLDGIMAGVLAHNGDVFVTNIPSLWKLTDSENQGVADKREELLTGFGPNIAFFGHDLHGLIVGPDGRLYFSVGDRGFNVKSKEGREFVGPRTGGVFRCDLDGRNLEVVHRGLRNPQELAFDQYGNLFADDNNCDKGDHGRLVYVCDGGDSGWNMAYQTIPDPYLTGPWHAERMWHLPHAGQPAWIVPCVGSIGTGPSGFLFTSGTSLPDRYKNAFLMCNYTGNGGLEAWKLKPQGAGFEIVDYHDFLKPIKATDVDLGPDGKLYLSDYVDLNWDGRSAGGRVYTVFDPAKIETTPVKEMKQLFAEGFKQRKPDELAKLLDHPELKVRQRAQFALADQRAVKELTAAAKESGNQLTRLHGIWGLWQLSRKDLKVLPTVAELLTDTDAEVRAQAAKVVGDRRHEPATEKLLEMLKDDSPRVRYFTAQALGQMKHKPAVGPLFEVLKANADADPFLRHAAATALARIGDADAVAARATDASAAVRMGAVLALRKLADKRVSRFLKDAEVLVRAEAARAINDLPIESEQPTLAAALADAPTAKSDALARRALHAAYRLGGADRAKAVFGVVVDANYSAPLRAEALACLKQWVEPTPRDRVNGFWRPLEKRDGKAVSAVVEKGLPDLLGKTSGQLQADAIGLVAALGVKADEAQFEAWAADAKQDVNLRAAALRFLAVRKAKGFDAAYQTAVKDPSPALRATARDLLAEVNPDKATETLAAVLNDENAPTVERQRGVVTLARLKGGATEIDTWAEKLAAGTVPDELKVDVWDALKANETAKRKPLRQKFEATLPPDPVGRFAMSRTGGDAERGKEIFFNHTAAQCVRCHKAGDNGGNAGPELNGLVTRYPDKTRDHLLESLVKPNAKIAPGYASITITKLDGSTVAGTLMTEANGDVEVKTPEGKLVTVKAADIDTKTAPVSAMPAVDKALTHREMRDLIEYLMTLK